MNRQAPSIAGVLVTVLALALALPASPAQAAGVVSVCDEASLKAALSGGGTVTFTCGGTIVLTSPITITADTTIDGSGQAVIISGNNKVPVFTVSSGIKLNLNRLTIADGRSLIGGGGILNNGGTVTINNSTLYGNSVGLAGGGAINSEGGTVTISNSTFYDNSGGLGGAIFGSLATITVTNSTFAGDKAVYHGDTIYNAECANCESGRVLLQNSIFADDGLYFSCEGPNIIDGGGNLSYSDFSCPGIHLDAMLGPLQNNGGPTPTIALGAGSAAIDAANNSICAASPINNLDQRGVTRPIDGDGNGTATCDIGAVEQQPVGAPRPPLTRIDIKPGSDPNTINCRNANEVITVAILTADSFDATTVDHRTVTFAGAGETHVDNKTGEPRRHVEDFDGDGDVDLVFHFRLGSTRLTCESTLALLVGKTLTGQPIWGIDSVRMVGGG